MEKIIYHGSDHIIEKPKFGYGKPYNDYGIGFYCTQNPNMAKEWGVGIDHNGYANRYKIECDGLTILDLNAPGYTMLHWLTILLENREFDTSAPLAAEAKEYLMNTFHLDYKSADIIIGYRADDSYFSFASDFINGAISYRQLCNAMRLGKLGPLNSWNFSAMRPQTLKNGIRKRPSVTRQPAANILTWSATAVRGETFILPRFSTRR